MTDQSSGYSIADLARLADVTPRTIRYYVAQGLLPPPQGVGPGRHYGRGHLDRLLLIRQLQRQHLPLAEIRDRLSGLDDAALGRLVREAGEPAPPPDSALDYIRTILGTGAAVTTPEQGPRPPAAPTSPARPPQRTDAPLRLARLLHAPTAAIAPGRRDPAAVSEVPAPYVAAPAARPSAAAAMPAMRDVDETARSQWDRIVLTPNVELHVRRPLSRHENRRVERLITIARQVLREEQP